MELMKVPNSQGLAAAEVIMEFMEISSRTQIWELETKGEARLENTPLAVPSQRAIAQRSSW